MREIVLGVDVGIRYFIVTSALEGFGDETFHSALKKYEETKYWIAEQVLRGSIRIISIAQKYIANVIVFEDLKIDRLNIDENEKMVLKALINQIKEDSKKFKIKIDFVNPMNTSHICSNCGYFFGIRTYENFYCPKCGFEENSDLNAAKNIGIRYILKNALADLRKGKEPWEKYYLATYSGAKSIDDLNWVRPILEKYKLKYEKSV